MSVKGATFAMLEMDRQVDRQNIGASEKDQK